MIISKYIRKEISYTVITITALLVLIGMCNQIATILNKAVHGELAKNAVLYIVAFSMPYFLAVLLPLGVFIAIYLVFTRLYSEQEMVILQMSGLNKWSLIKIISLPLMVIALIACFINLWLAPTVLRYRDILMDKAELINAATMLAAGHFQVIAGGRYVIYVQEADTNNKQFSNIFVAEQPSNITNKKNKSNKSDKWDIFISKSGSEQKLADFDNNKAIVMQDGYQYQGLPGQNDFYQMKFSDYAFELPKQTIKGKLRRRAKTSNSLLQSASLHDLAELHSRINLIISPLVLALFALSMSSLKPRQARYSKLLPTIILVLIYYNLMLASEDWLEQGFIPIVLGASWLHLSMIALSFYLLFKKNK